MGQVFGSGAFRGAPFTIRDRMRSDFADDGTRGGHRVLGPVDRTELIDLLTVELKAL